MERSSIRLKCWLQTLAVSALVVGCSKNQSSELLVVEDVIPPVHSSAVKVQSRTVQSPPQEEPAVDPTRMDAAEYVPRKRAAAAQADHTGLSRSVLSDSTREQPHGSPRHGHAPLQQQESSTKAPRASVDSPVNVGAQEQREDVDPPSSAAGAASPWHHLLNAPTTQGEPIIPVEPLDLQKEREALDALVLPDGDPRAALIGCWRQVGGATGADFGNGGYTQSFVLFRTDGLLDLVRFYGTDRTIRLVKRYDYVVASEGVISLGLSKEYRPQFPPRVQRLPGRDGEIMVIAPPAITLPCKLKYTASNDTIELHRKKYERVKLDRPAESDSSDH